MLLEVQDFRLRVSRDLHGLVQDLQLETGRFGSDEALAWEASLVKAADRCKYVSPDGHRCEETRRAEPHHLDPWVLTGDVNDPDAYELRCSAHNQSEGRLYFGKRRRGDDAGRVRERPAPYGTRSFSAELVPEQISLSPTHPTP